MANSQNGWPVNPPRRSRLVAGTPDVRLVVADGPAGDVLMHVAARFHRLVEPLTLDSRAGELDDWGYASRPIRGGTDISNHASATGVDFNATRHPLGDVGTFTTAQRQAIHRILADVSHVVRWGGDYTGRKDEMHFEINAGPDEVAAVAARLALREDDDMTPRELMDAKFNPTGDAVTALDAWKDKPGTVGHFLRNLGQDTDALRKMVKEQSAALEAMRATLEAVRKAVQS